ncbi:MAG: nucleotide exchange factor GrpE [Planctomycetota bacterium]
MSGRNPGYWRRLLEALLGRDPGAGAPAEAPPADEQVAEARARAATLEMDLRERDERVERLRAEYEALRAERDRAVGRAGQEQMEQLLKRLAGPLSNLIALAELAEAGQDVEVKDLTSLVRGVEKPLARAGLEAVGKVGEETRFDVAVHQRMSGGAVRGGTPVVVRLPGYRLGDKVLLKAMVSARED